MPRDGLAVELAELRLRIPGIHVRRGALREDVNDMLGLDREMRALRHERGAGDRARGALCIPGIDAKEAGEAQRAKTHSGTDEQLAARKDVVIRRSGMLADIFG